MLERVGPQTLAIFDVDGTLLKNKTVVRDEFLGAFEDVSGEALTPQGVHFAGMTDRGIVRALLASAGLEPEFDPFFRRFEARFAERLEPIYPTHPDPHLLLGVPELLEALNAIPGVALALGTGNCRSTCAIKLRRFGLERYFRVGGYGGDHEVRADAIRAAMEEGRQRLGWDGEAWVIGDTVRDVAAGHEAGAKVLAVATGLEPTATLTLSHPDALLPDLSDTARVLEILGVG